MTENPSGPLRQGWVFSKRTCVFRGIQFTRHFIEFVVVETNQIVGTNSNEILTRQTCGQRSGMAAVSKHRAIAFYFSVRIYYMFLMSKCTGKSDLGLCMTSVLAKRMPLRSFKIARDVVNVLIIYVDIYHFNYTFSHEHIEAHTHNVTQAHMYD